MTLEDILKSIEIKQTREEAKGMMRQMKNNGMTQNEIKALYRGISMQQEEYIILLPMMTLWINEVWNEEKKDESL